MRSLLVLALVWVLASSTVQGAVARYTVLENDTRYPVEYLVAPSSTWHPLAPKASVRLDVRGVTMLACRLPDRPGSTVNVPGWWDVRHRGALPARLHVRTTYFCAYGGTRPKAGYAAMLEDK